MTIAAVEVKSLCYAYSPGKNALDQVSFCLQTGSFNALLGNNGAGKSTLFALLTGLFATQGGELEIMGRTLKRDSAYILSRLGVVFQQSTLDLDLSVEQNLFYHGSLHGMKRSLVRERMAVELAAFDLQGMEKRKVRQLNGGHRRRLELARSLLHGPELLLLDEPSVGLDVATRGKLNQRIRELCQQRGLTVLWTTHLIEEVQQEDYVLLLDQGRLLAQGSGHELCQRANASHLGEAFLSLTGKAA